MPRERILITVKTYPTLSRKYGETVCTAGLREDGSWMRIYPVPFRRLGEKEQYSKFDWIEATFVKSTKDSRPETYHPVDWNEFRPVGKMGTSDNWAERRRLLLEKCVVHSDIKSLAEDAHENRRSLAIFKPANVDGVIWKEEDSREWDERKVQEMVSRFHSGDLFEEQKLVEPFRLARKLPYAFSYKFRDTKGVRSELRILDWECGMLYWNCLKIAGGNETEALGKVRQKYFDEFTKRDLHFLLGTSLEWHLRAPNPWMIIGVFAPPFPTGKMQLHVGL
jgi:hypothetical protein